MTDTMTTERPPASFSGIETTGPVELGTFDPVGTVDQPATAERISSFVSDGQAMKALAVIIAESGAYKVRNWQTVLAIMLAAYELNIGIQTALKGMYPVSGKLELETWLLAGLAIMRTAVRWDDVEVTDRKVVLRLHRDEWEPKLVEYSLEHAQKMGLIRDLDLEAGTFKTSKVTDPWNRSTEEMLYWRCLSKGLKRIAPDYFGGMYVRGELVAAIAAEGSTSTAASDLAALVSGVEPDELEYSEDEIATYSDEVRDAKKTKTISPQKAKAMLDAIVSGKWDKCRKDQDKMRRAVLAGMDAPEAANGDDETEPESAQGTLI